MSRAALIGLILALSSSVALAAGETGSQERPLHETNPSNALATATDAGIRRCAGALAKITEHLFRSEESKRLRTHATWGTWHRNSPNDRLYVANVGTQFADGTTLANIAAAPTPGTTDACDITYTTVYSERRACQLVRERSFDHLPFVDDMNGDSLVLGKEDAALRVLLLPQGESKDHCLVVMTETMYGLK